MRRGKRNVEFVEQMTAVWNGPVGKHEDGNSMMEKSVISYKSNSSIFIVG